MYYEKENKMNPNLFPSSLFRSSFLRLVIETQCKPILYSVDSIGVTNPHVV
jgi:hypothetical protein